MRTSLPAATGVHRFSRACYRLAAIFAALALVLSSGFAMPRRQARAAETGLVQLGQILPPDTSANDGRIVAVDRKRRQLYYLWSAGGDTKLSAYALGGPHSVPKLVRTATLFTGPPPESQSPFVVYLDTKRDRLGLLSVGTAKQNPIIRLVDLKTFTLVGKTNPVDEAEGGWELATRVPGFYPFGLTYSAQDDRIYLVGEMTAAFSTANSNPTFGRKAAGPGSGVVALNPEDGSMVWARVVPECQQVLSTLFVGALVARGKGNTVQFACVSGGPGTGGTFPGQAGLVTMHIDPKAADSAAALNFGVDFAPVSGSYFNGSRQGIAAFDPASDRFFLQSLAVTTPGAWVHDGVLDGWAGIVPFPDNSNYYGGFSEYNGHFYMGGNTTGQAESGGLVVADGRALPIQPGDVYPYKPQAFVVTDPFSNRLFMFGLNAQGYTGTWVLDDRTLTQTPDVAPDYDAGTDDIPESADTYVSYDASSAGFGAAAINVGGTRGVLSPLGNNAPKLPAAPSTRGLVAARVPTVGMRTAGASAAAMEAAVDTSTGAELSGNGHPWPYEAKSCLDGGGEKVPPQHQEDDYGFATATCDFARQHATGEAEMGLHAGPLTVGYNTVKADTFRTDERGTVTQTVAVSRGIRLNTPAGSLTIGEVTASVETAAHGQTGTSVASWKRTVRNLAITDTSGKPVYEAPGCTTTLVRKGGGKLARTDEGDCTKLEDTVRRLLQIRVELKFPEPELVATPKGAFATVRQTKADYYIDRTGNDLGVVFDLDSVARRLVPAVQFELYNDSTERSRIFVQLAAIESSSIYQISKGGDLFPDEPIDSGPGPQSGNVAPPALSTGGSGETVTPGTPGTPPYTVAGRPRAASPVVGLVVVRRAMTQALVMGTVLLLFAGAVSSVLRRRRLVSSIES